MQTPASTTRNSYQILKNAGLLANAINSPSLLNNNRIPPLSNNAIQRANQVQANRQRHPRVRPQQRARVNLRRVLVPRGP
jgi:hypothetical protein